MATQKIEFLEILSGANKLLNSNSFHFLALSAIFSYPLVLLLVAFPVLQQITNIHIPQFSYNLNYISSKHIIFFVLYAFALLTLYICATATITYSSYHVISGRRVKFMYTIKSMSKSFIRLLATFFCTLIIIFAGLLAIASSVFGIIEAFECLGFHIKYSSKYFVVLKFMLGFGLLYLCVNWVLAPVIVVVEKSWGLEALKRSTYLVKGGRGVVVCLILCFCLIMWVPLFASWNSTNLDGFMDIATLIFCPLGFMVYLLYSFTAYTVLYMKCKTLRGELPGEIEEEYVSLSVDEEEVPHFVSADQSKIDDD